jgi:hypothetical protein
MARVLELKSITNSVLFFFSFFIATTLYLIPLLLAVPLLKSDFIGRIGIYLGILAGVWFLIQGIVGVCS